MDSDYFRQSRAVAQLVLTANQVFKSVTALVRRYELTESQYNALRILRGAARRNEELTQAELAERLIASRANTTWILDKLAARGLIRRRDHSDRRKNIVEITDAGRRMLEKIDPDFEALLNGMLTDVRGPELDALLKITAKFRFE